MYDIPVVHMDNKTLDGTWTLPEHSSAASDGSVAAVTSGDPEAMISQSLLRKKKDLSDKWLLDTTIEVQLNVRFVS